MLIIYCEKCGHRISDEERKSGSAVEFAENQWHCAACNAPAQTPQRPKSGSVIAQVPASGPPPTQAHVKRQTSTNLPRPASGSQGHPRKDAAPASNSKAVVIAASVGGLCLIVGLILIMSGRKPKDSVAKVEGAAPTVERKTEPLPTKTETPAVTTKAVDAVIKQNNVPPAQMQPLQTTPANTEGNKAESGSKAETLQLAADRARQADKELENLRFQRATKLFEEHVAWFKQNPAEGWTYKLKLQDFVSKYGSSPSAAEARKIIEELKDVQPPPDRMPIVAAETSNYQLVYDLDLARLGADNIAYNVDNRASIKQPFDRVAYFLELQKQSGDSQYIYVSMDAFTDDLGKIGIPTVSSNAKFQQKISNMNVISNVNGIVGGTLIPTGNIEFWPNNYGAHNGINIPNALNDKYDFGDSPSDPPQGYGSMQVHNYDAKQTLFAINKWNAGDSADIGIGNNPNAGGNPDWTFSSNGGGYRTKRLRVLVHLK